MDKEKHEFFNSTVRDFNAWDKLTQKVVSQLETLRSKLVEYENDVASGEFQILKKRNEIEALDKEARERKLLLDASAGQLRDDIEKRRNEVADREARLQIREQQLRVQQEKLDRLLSAAERVHDDHDKEKKHK